MEIWMPALQQIEKEVSMNVKKEILHKELDKDRSGELEQFLRMTYGDQVLFLDSKTIENSLGINTVVRHKDIGQRLEWWAKSRGSSTLLYYSDNGSIEKENNFEEFLKLFSELVDARGSEAERKLKDFFSNCDAVSAKWYSRCLVKNLMSGISSVTINKVLSELNRPLIAYFELSLCSLIDCSSKEKISEQIWEIIKKYGKVYVEPKYDGVRLVLRNCIYSRKTNTIAMSRNGKTVSSIPNLLNEFDRVFGEKKLELDGELVAKDFQTLMTQVHRKNDLDILLPREYMVFDILTYDGTDISFLPYTERRKILEKLFADVDSQMIKLVKNEEASNPSEVMNSFNRAVNLGHEGVIIKTNQKYTRDRSAWWKMKPIKEASLKVVDVELGSGKYKDVVSRIKVQDKSGELESWVGSGLTDEVRNEITGKDIVGKIVEVQYDSITKVNVDGKRSLRFPRFLRFRSDLGEADLVR